MSTTYSTEQYAETLLVAMLNFFICFFGIILNGLALLTVLKSSRFQNSYGTLSFNHSCLNLAILLVYFLWVTPTTYVQSSDADSLFGKIIGQLYLLFWICIIYSHLALTLNRFITLIFPRRSNSQSFHNTSTACIVIIWLVGLCHIIPLFWYDDCFLTYDPVFWIWNIGSTKCGQNYRLFVMQYWCLIIMMIILIFNIVVVFYLKLKSPFAARSSEIKLFIEAMTKSTAFLLVMICSNVLGNVFVQRWERFVFTTLAWQLYHLFDGLLVVFLHFDRKLLAEHRELRELHPVSFINVDNHPHHGHHPHSHDSLHRPHHDIHILHHHQFSKVDTV